MYAIFGDKGCIGQFSSHNSLTKGPETAESDYVTKTAESDYAAQYKNGLECSMDLRQIVIMVLNVFVTL